MIHKISIEFEKGRAPHNFSLGLGPCGRNVRALAIDTNDTWVSVVQYVDGDEDPAIFNYAKAGIFRVSTYNYNPDYCPYVANPE